ncbi:efflux RND transporter periplasmic adaptor subunit [Paracoccus contaminans]|uniref:efflux RND transporter periplasmic adaptor subunit n=1 Tax=Paracoccus contaminans TaxID=1945662 RepID=UPI0012F4C79E|nr:efflux RND transporter periplasmic adaptor subunit [Paracoccus contaminans]
MSLRTTFRLALAATIGALIPLAAGAQEGAPKPSVTVVAAQPTDFTLSARLPGRIKASTVAEVRPQVSGIIRERQFEEGSNVEAGQALYTIEPETYASAVAAAKASVAQAQANFDLTQREARRAQELFARNNASGAARDSALAARDAADAALQLAKAQQQSAEIDLDRTTIRAPIAGVIGFSQATAGSLVAAQQTAALTTIRSLDPIYVDVTQSANDLLRWQQSHKGGGVLATGQATLILPTGDIYPVKGELRAAEPQVEPTTGMITLRVSFANPDHLLLPGLYVEVALPQQEEKGVYMVPQMAVMRDQQGTAKVWVVENGVIAERPLKVLTADGNNWVVTEGLKPGDLIVTSGFQKAGPGAPVDIAAPEAGAEGAAAGQAAPEGASTAGGEHTSGTAAGAPAPADGAGAAAGGTAPDGAPMGASAPGAGAAGGSAGQTSEGGVDAAGAPQPQSMAQPAGSAGSPAAGAGASSGSTAAPSEGAGAGAAPAQGN